MNTVLSLSNTAPSAAALSGRDAAAADPAGSPFAAFLDSAAGNAVAEGQAPGIALPTVPLTGNILPPGLAPLGEDPPAEGEAEAGDTDPGTTDVALAVLSTDAVLMAALPQPLAAPAPAQAAAPPANAAPGASAPAMPPSLPRSAPPPLQSLTIAQPASPSVEGQAAPVGGVAVALAMDAGPTGQDTPADAASKTEPRAVLPAAPASPRIEPQGETRFGDTARREGAAAEQALPSAHTLAPAAASDATFAGFASTQPASSLAPAAAAAPAAPAQPVQELSRILDRLTAAREALAPATAAIAIDHAEFGELTLRFEQQKDGQLLVGLSAPNADAHRAVAAALAAERQNFTGADQSQQQQAQQRSTGGASSQSDRGGHAGPNAGHSGGSGSQPGSGQARHDSPRQASANQARRPASAGESRPSGIYA